MKATDYALHVGYLAVRKNTVGTVGITTDPAVTLVDGETVVLARTHDEVRHVFDTTNLRELAQHNLVLLVF